MQGSYGHFSTFIPRLSTAETLYYRVFHHSNIHLNALIPGLASCNVCIYNSYATLKAHLTSWWGRHSMPPPHASGDLIEATQSFQLGGHNYAHRPLDINVSVKHTSCVVPKFPSPVSVYLFNSKSGRGSPASWVSFMPKLSSQSGCRS